MWHLHRGGVFVELGVRVCQFMRLYVCVSVCVCVCVCVCACVCVHSVVVMQLVCARDDK